MPDDGEMTIGQVATHGYSLDGLVAEIEQCEVPCANCHREGHHPAPDAVDEVSFGPPADA